MMNKILQKNLKIRYRNRFRKYFGAFYNRKLMLLKFYAYFQPLKIELVKTQTNKYYK